MNHPLSWNQFSAQDLPFEKGKQQKAPFGYPYGAFPFIIERLFCWRDIEDHE
jgi:hypothetical protein